MCVGLALRLSGASALAFLCVSGPVRCEPAPTAPIFIETACDLPDLSPDMAPRLRCGTVGVPRHPGDPISGVFDLSVVVVRSTNPAPLPDPVLFISGGPGSPLTIYAEAQGRHPYAPDRDLILVDQRGTGRSQPRICRDLDRDFLAASLAIASVPSAETLRKSHDLHMACRDEAVTRGIDLADFGTTVTVEDLERVRVALGVDRWNVVGESYGTTVAMNLLARHPETVRSAVLDSLYPPDPDLPPWSKRVADATEAFLAFCGRDEACSSLYPDLAGTYRDAMRRLASEPLVAAVPPSLGFPGDAVRLTPTLLEAVVGLMVYYPSYYRALPRLIAAVRDGDVRPFEAGLAALLAAASVEDNEGLRAAVECRDRPRDRARAPADLQTLDAMLLPGVCADWSSLGPPPLIPVGTTVPVLVLAGEFDPNIEPELSRHVTDRIGPRARWLLFPQVGHNVRHFSPCAAKIVSEFIVDPSRYIDASCAERPLPIRFAPH